jgi:cytochrome o ubiquinol oxidase subunit 3
MGIDASAKHRDEFNKTTLGFWIYLMTDSVLFASLFATYAVLRGGTAGSVSGADIFELDFVFVETTLLLVSSLTSGLALVGIRLASRKFIALMLGMTFLLGAAFLAMELFEFTKLAQEGYGWTTSAFLSAFFGLVGTHGLHIAVGLIWLSGLMMMLYKKGLTNTLHKRLALFSLYWHFLDIIWIFIFTLVYLMGVIA